MKGHMNRTINQRAFRIEMRVVEVKDQDVRSKSGSYQAKVVSVYPKEESVVCVCMHVCMKDIAIL